MSEKQLNLDFGLEEKRLRALTELKNNIHYRYYKDSGSIYLRPLTSDPNRFKVEVRVFASVEVEWFYIMTVDFDVAVYFFNKDIADIHWAHRDKLIQKFKEWKRDDGN